MINVNNLTPINKAAAKVGNQANCAESEELTLEQKRDILVTQVKQIKHALEYGQWTKKQSIYPRNPPPPIDRLHRADKCAGGQEESSETPKRCPPSRRGRSCAPNCF